MYQARDVSASNVENGEVLPHCDLRGCPRRPVRDGCRYARARTHAVAVAAAIVIGGVMGCSQLHKNPNGMTAG